MSTARNKCIIQCNPSTALPINIIVELEKGWKTDNKVDSIKCGSNRICHISIFKRIIGICRNRQGFHKGGEVGKGQDYRDIQHGPQQSFLKGSDHSTQHKIGKCMVGSEIKMRRKEKANRDIVEAMCWHGVLCLEHRVEI
jgi:hypothetical protein